MSLLICLCPKTISLLFSADVIHEGAQRRILLRCREFPGGGEEQNFGNQTTLCLKLEGEEIGRKRDGQHRVPELILVWQKNFAEPWTFMLG